MEDSFFLLRIESLEDTLAKYKTIPVIPGALCRRLQADGREAFGYFRGDAETDYDGQLVGAFQVYGQPNELGVKQGDEILVGWEIYSVPDKLKEPIKGDSPLSTEDELRMKLARAEAEVAALRKQTRK